MIFLRYWKNGKIAIRNTLYDSKKSIVLPITWIAIEQLTLAKLLSLIVWHSEVQFQVILDLQSPENDWLDWDRKWWFMQNQMTDLWLSMEWLTAVANDGGSQI